MLGLVVYLLLSVVTWFVIPSEIKYLYEQDGRESPLSGWWGLWFLLPIVGAFVWFVRDQGALNEFWRSKGVAAS